MFMLIENLKNFKDYFILILLLQFSLFSNEKKVKNLQIHQALCCAFQLILCVLLDFTLSSMEIQDTRDIFDPLPYKIAMLAEG